MVLSSPLSFLTQALNASKLSTEQLPQLTVTSRCKPIRTRTHSGLTNRMSSDVMSLPASCSIARNFRGGGGGWGGGGGEAEGGRGGSNGGGGVGGEEVAEAEAGSWRSIEWCGFVARVGAGRGEQACVWSVGCLTGLCVGCWLSNRSVCDVLAAEQACV
jgi:hypothetical protein